MDDVKLLDEHRYDKDMAAISQLIMNY